MTLFNIIVPVAALAIGGAVVLIVHLTDKKHDHPAE